MTYTLRAAALITTSFFIFGLTAWILSWWYYFIAPEIEMDPVLLEHDRKISAKQVTTFPTVETTWEAIKGQARAYAARRKHE